MQLKNFYLLYFLYLWAGFFTTLAVPPAPSVPLVSADKILAIIFHTEGSSIVLQSDLKANLEGITKSLNDVVLERLMVIDAENLKIAVTDADIDRHLGLVQKQHGLSQEATVELFKQMGLTFEEARKHLRTKLLVENVLDHRVKRKVMVGTQIIEKYDQDHPIIKEAEYKLSQAFIPYAGSSPTLQKIKVEQAISSGEIKSMVNWGEPFILRESDIADDKASIKSLNVDQSVIVNISPEGISLLRLISKKDSYRVPLKEREAEIMNILAKELFEKVFGEYQERLFKTARIKYL